jgi:light-regulated signal transduction histidine kinase (bacteriophytochrome)
MDAEGQRYLGEIRDASQRMAAMIEDLLRLAQIGRQQLKLQKTSIKDLIDDVLADLKSEVCERRIEWRVGELPSLECDRGLIKQVFTNLVGNAVKYTRPREVAVIEIGHCDGEGHPVIFVRDNGAGFEMKYADKLFGAFQRLHRQDEFEGTGVGLATVHRIIRRHGGRIWAEAEPQKGATFYFTLA